MRRFSILSLLACALLSCSSDPLARKQSDGNAATPSPATTGDNPEKSNFDGDRAFAHVKAQVDFGPRPAGSASIEKTREYILRELKSYGLKVIVDEFTPVTPRGKLRMKNIIAELTGETTDTLIIASHYDTKPFKEFTFVGANDGGSSTGALLEIARVMALEKAAGKSKLRATYQFVFFDGEESFCREWSECLEGNDNTYGSRHMADRLKKENQIDRVKALILMDMIGDQDLEIRQDENSSRLLIETIWNTARRLGYSKHFPERTIYMTDDHIPFLKVGIDAIDLIDFEYGGEENLYWHTKEDTLDKISPRSLKIVGDVILLSLPQIESQSN